MPLANQREFLRFLKDFWSAETVLSYFEIFEVEIPNKLKLDSILDLEKESSSESDRSREISRDEEYEKLD